MQWDARHSNLIPAVVITLGMAPALFLPHASTSVQVQDIDLHKVLVNVDKIVRETLSKEVSAILPVPSKDVTPGSYLTNEGIFMWTNFERHQEGPLPALTESTLLDEIADQRLADMFDQQYFAHYSPEGYGAKDVANNLGYQYLLLGENIALGVFKNDRVIVDAWMNSPAHRENIMNKRYKEIGVSAGVGKYEGRYAWIGVQIFGLPLSSCPQIDQSLKDVILAEKVQILRLQKAADELRGTLQVMPLDTDQQLQDYANKARIYNVFVDRINYRANEVNRLVKEYNKQVEAYNGC